MKILIALIKFIFKIFLILVGISLFFTGIFLAMVYFSTPQYYTGFIEKVFTQGTGQQLRIMGDIIMKPGKNLNTTLNNSVITIKANIGDIKIITQNFSFGIPWNVLYNYNFSRASVGADQVIVEVIKDKKVISTYAASSVSAQMERHLSDLQLNDLKLMTKDGDLNGNITIMPSTEHLKVTGNLHAKNWTINTAIDPKKKMVALEGIQALEGTIVFTIDTLHTPQGDMHNVEALVDLGAKSLTIQSSHVILSLSHAKE